MRLEFHVLPRPVSTAFLGMTFGLFAELLRQVEGPDYLLPIGVLGEGRPLGFGLARKQPDRQVGEILSLFVDPAYQKLGVGTKLLEMLEHGLAVVGCREAEIGYHAPSPGQPALERVLQKRGWAPPEPRMIGLEITRSALIDGDAGWLQRCTVPPGYSWFPWVEITEEERDALQAIRETVPPVLWPFTNDAPDPVSSIGVRHQGEVVGWIIGHQRTRELLHWSILYVREPWRTSRLSMALVAESVRRAREQPSERALIEVQIENEPMIRLLQRRWLPHAVNVRELRRAVRTLLA